MDEAPAAFTPARRTKAEINQTIRGTALVIGVDVNPVPTLLPPASDKQMDPAGHMEP